MKQITQMLVVLLFGLIAVGNAAAEGTESRKQADADYAADRYEAAAAKYEKWVETHPKDHEAWFRLGNAYNNLIQPMKALAAWRAAQKLKPKDPRAWHNMGLLYLRMAVESYDNLRRNVPKNDPMVPFSQHAINSILNLISYRALKEPRKR